MFVRIPFNGMAFKNNTFFFLLINRLFQYLILNNLTSKLTKYINYVTSFHVKSTIPVNRSKSSIVDDPSSLSCGAYSLHVFLVLVLKINHESNSLCIQTCTS